MTPSTKIAGAAAILGAISTIMLCSACQVEGNANVKASGSANESSASVEENVTSTPPPADSTAPAPAPAPPTTAQCPLSCYEAQGPTRVLVREEEQTQLRTALDPVLERIHACGGSSDDSGGGGGGYRGRRRDSSPTIHLRIAPDGTLADLGIDPSQGGDANCLQSAARGVNPTISLPGRKAIRCVERCAHTNQAGDQPRRRNRR
jgi:hypothetical protein